MPLYVARPHQEPPWPGVLVISDALGMTTDLKNQVDWLASEGFLAAAPDLYYWGGRIRCMFSAMRQGLAREGQYFEDFHLVREWLARQEGCSGKVGVIGFCMGGGFALLLAPTGDYDASSVNYGTVPKDAMTFLADACPIVASFGEKDSSLRKARAELEKALGANHVVHDIKVYPDTGHGFMNDHDSNDVPMWALISGKLVTTEYHEESAMDARGRIVSFFTEHLE
jgi:carboxymethylenebutenolidase